MPYGIIFEAVDSLKQTKLLKDELEERKQELTDLIVNGISRHRIPESTLTYTIVSHEAVKNKEKLDQAKTIIDQLQTQNRQYQDKFNEMDSIIQQLRNERKVLKEQAKSNNKQNKVSA